MLAIIDYDAGNIKSVEKAFEYLGQEAVVTKDSGLKSTTIRVIQGLILSMKRMVPAVVATPVKS